MDEKERIEKVMLSEGMNSAVFATEIGIQGSTLSHILNGRNKPSLDVLKKVLNRFRTVSSDWLILGIGAMYRSEKHSQAPTLFDSIGENDNKSTIYEQKIATNSKPVLDVVQNNVDKANEVESHSMPFSPETLNKFNTPIEAPAKSVKKIIVYYTDNTFQEFETK